MKAHVLSLGLVTLMLSACGGGHEKVQAVDRVDVAAERAKAAFPEAEKITFDDEGAPTASQATTTTDAATTADAASTEATNTDTAAASDATTTAESTEAEAAPASN